ncbi:VTT domain-containing protein [Micromonospora sp. HUAS LYJ1]|uniref:VTT domain-containing protein n=1 Tax=Micromonospora sp. HUAS LYJ1 TaxID=3061626 RepID=UPI002670F124|nr:VTT domain-containing protein [Micromonospora sp. HUAS LYJ1]WKU03091.1 VTT domain-containing protein [Micromonospora sp. HUAS LYJ1]
MAVDTGEKTRVVAETVALNPLDPKDLLQTFGLIGVWVILFAETGLLVGFFFPGDSLLFLAGVAASPVADAIFGDGTRLSLAGLLIGGPICAIVGAQLGHWLGARYGRRMFDRPNSRLFKKEYVEKAEFYFQKFGPAKAVVLARFIPIVRTFLNPVAGVLGMPAKQFFLWNVVGAILWVDGILLIGYLLADQIYNAVGDKIDRYILPVVALIILISVLPIFFEFLRDRKARRRGETVAVITAATAVGTMEAVRDAVEHHRHDQPRQPHPGQPSGGGQAYGQQPGHDQRFPPQTYGQRPPHDGGRYPEHGQGH